MSSSSVGAIQSWAGGICSLNQVRRKKKRWFCRQAMGNENFYRVNKAQSAFERAAQYLRDKNRKTLKKYPEDDDDDEEKKKPVKNVEKKSGEGDEKSKKKEEDNGGVVKGSEEIDGDEVEVEIITRDGVIKRKSKKPRDYFMSTEVDIMTLDFMESSEEIVEPVGAAEGSPQPQLESVNNSEPIIDELYKPKVSTWGVFPRPANISKTFGGGRTIKPGEELQTEEQREASKARTKQILSDYRRKMGLEVDPAVASECQELMEKGNGLAKSGNLREAIKLFESIIQKMVFQTELHGKAALAKGLCLESLNSVFCRSGEARAIYEKLRSHSNLEIKKKARELAFAFQAAERLNFAGASSWDTSAYQQYFELIPRKYRRYNTYKASEDDSPGISMNELFPYVVLLFAPIILVFALAAIKRTILL